MEAMGGFSTRSRESYNPPINNNQQYSPFISQQQQQGFQYIYIPNVQGESSTITNNAVGGLTYPVPLIFNSGHSDGNVAASGNNQNNAALPVIVPPGQINENQFEALERRLTLKMEAQVKEVNDRLSKLEVAVAKIQKKISKENKGKNESGSKMAKNGNALLAKDASTSTTCLNPLDKIDRVRLISAAIEKLESGSLTNLSNQTGNDAAIGHQRSPPKRPGSLPPRPSRNMEANNSTVIKKERVAHAFEQEGNAKCFRCICGHEASSRTTLWNHVKRKGAVELRFKCPEPGCEKRYLFPSLVTAHLRNGHGKRGQANLLGCKKCYGLFENVRELDGHRNSRNQICKNHPRRPPIRISLARPVKLPGNVTGTDSESNGNSEQHVITL